jgi:hypothetical protein
VFKGAELAFKMERFGLVVIDTGASSAPLPQSNGPRLAHEAECSGDHDYPAADMQHVRGAGSEAQAYRIVVQVSALASIMR